MTWGPLVRTSDNRPRLAASLLLAVTITLMLPQETSAFLAPPPGASPRLAALSAAILKAPEILAPVLQVSSRKGTEKRAYQVLDPTRNPRQDTPPPPPKNSLKVST